MAVGRGAERTTKRLPSCSISVWVSESRLAMISGQELERPSAAMWSIQRLLQHQRKETAEHVTADGLLEDRPRSEARDLLQKWSITWKEMDTKPSRFAEEQIIGILREQEAGATTADVCQAGGSSAMFYKWKVKYGGLDVSDAKRLKSLEDENAKLYCSPSDDCRCAGAAGASVRSAQKHRWGQHAARCATPTRSPRRLRSHRSVPLAAHRHPMRSQPAQNHWRASSAHRARQPAFQCGLSAPCVKQIGMDIVPARNLGNVRLRCQTLLDDPSLLGRGPSPSSFGTRKNRRCRHDCAHCLQVNGHTSSRAYQSGKVMR
jgi:putative transposase